MECDGIGVQGNCVGHQKEPDFVLWHSVRDIQRPSTAENLASLANKVNRVQRFFCQHTHTCTLNYRPGKLNSNADLLSRLPFPATEQDESPDMRLTHPADVDVYMIGASGIMSAQIGPGWGGLSDPKQSGACDDFVVGEKHRARPRLLTTDELSREIWQVMQQTREQTFSRVPKIENESATAWPDNTSLIDQRETVVSGQWEPGLLLHACPITEIGRKILGIEPSQHVLTITPGGGSSAGGSNAVPGTDVSGQNHFDEEAGLSRVASVRFG